VDLPAITISITKRSTVTYPINNTRCQEVYADKLQNQVEQVKPKTVNELQRYYGQGSHDGKTANGVKRIKVSLRNKPCQKKHRNILNNQKIVGAGKIRPVDHDIFLVCLFKDGIHHCLTRSG
jgi:hypothetical protein